MRSVYGSRLGLKANQIKRLENLGRRRNPPEAIVSYEVCRDLCKLSQEIGRQIGLLIDRSGKVVLVLLGEVDRILIPDLREYRLAPDRLRGIRCVHTTLSARGARVLVQRRDEPDVVVAPGASRPVSFGPAEFREAVVELEP